MSTVSIGKALAVLVFVAALVLVLIGQLPLTAGLMFAALAVAIFVG
jgi:hypothetical protein